MNIEKVARDLADAAKAVSEAFKSGHHPTFEQLSRLEGALYPFFTDKICGHSEETSGPPRKVARSRNRRRGSDVLGLGMNWWRAHHGISNDSKLAVVALRAGAKRCEVGWIWIVLLDYASQAEPRGDDRGSIRGLDAEQISLMTEIPIPTVEAVISALRARRWTRSARKAKRRR